MHLGKYRAASVLCKYLKNSQFDISLVFITLLKTSTASSLPSGGHFINLQQDKIKRTTVGMQCL